MTFDTLALPGNFMATTIHCLRGRQSFGLYAGRARQHLQQLTTTRVGAPSTFSVSANLPAQCRGSTTCRHARHSPVRLLTTNDQAALSLAIKPRRLDDNNVGCY